jgi:hypothetical protein
MIQAVKNAIKRTSSPVILDDRHTRVLISPLPIDLSRAGTSVTVIQPYELTPLVIAQVGIAKHTDQGIALDPFTFDSSLRVGHREVLPGRIAQTLANAYRQKGVVQVEALKGCENWPLYEQLQAVLYPASLGIGDPKRQDLLFDRISDHLQAVAVEHAGTGDLVEVRPKEFVKFGDLLAEVAKACIESNELGRTRRQSFFRDLGTHAIYQTIQVTDKQELWAKQLGIPLPRNVQIGNRLPGEGGFVQEAAMDPEIKAALLLALQSRVEAPAPAAAPALSVEQKTLIAQEAQRMFEEFLAKAGVVSAQPVVADGEPAGSAADDEPPAAEVPSLESVLAEVALGDVEPAPKGKKGGKQ